MALRFKMISAATNVQYSESLTRSEEWNHGAENAISLLLHVQNMQQADLALAGDIDLIEIEVLIQPEELNRNREEAVSLKLPAVKRQQAQGITVAHILLMGRAVRANKRDELSDFIEGPVRTTLSCEENTPLFKALGWQSDVNAG